MFALVGTRLHNCAFRLLIIFCNGLKWLKCEVFLIRSKDYLFCGYKDKYLECVYEHNQHKLLVVYHHGGRDSKRSSSRPVWTTESGEGGGGGGGGQNTL